MKTRLTPVNRLNFVQNYFDWELAATGIEEMEEIRNLEG
jgi:hypothetical protein